MSISMGMINGGHHLVNGGGSSPVSLALSNGNGGGSGNGNGNGNGNGSGNGNNMNMNLTNGMGGGMINMLGGAGNNSNSNSNGGGGGGGGGGNGLGINSGNNNNNPNNNLNGNGGGGNGGSSNNGMPMPSGHQSDLNYLYQMVLELSEVLRNNREMTKGIVNGADEMMKRAATAENNGNCGGGGDNGTAGVGLVEANSEISAARIAELERQLAKERQASALLRVEQSENVKLISEYETVVGEMVEQVRNYCQNHSMHYLAQKRHYNALLQDERDAHLRSRLESEHWYAQHLKAQEMIRTAFHIRSEEDDVPLRIIAGLQNEVRAYRNALGLGPEKPEDEFGWEFLKDYRETS